MLRTLGIRQNYTHTSVAQPASGGTDQMHPRASPANDREYPVDVTHRQAPACRRSGEPHIARVHLWGLSTLWSERSSLSTTGHVIPLPVTIKVCIEPHLSGRGFTSFLPSVDLSHPARPVPMSLELAASFPNPPHGKRRMGCPRYPACL